MNCHGLSSRLFIGGTGTKKTHLAVTIGFRAFRSGARAGFWNHVDPGNQLEQEKIARKCGRLSQMGTIVLDGLCATCRLRKTGDNCSFIFSQKNMRRPRHP